MSVKRELTRRNAMLAGRDTLGASDVAAIVGLDRFRDAADVYDDMVARLEGRMEVDDPNGDQLRGILLEDIAAELYAEREGLKMRRIGQQVHPDLPCLHANCDRQVLADETWDTHPAEIKVPRPQTFRRIKEHGADPYVVIQAQAQLACFPQYPYVRIVYLEPVEMGTYGIVLERRPDLIESLEKAVVRFWYEHVEKRVRPVVFQVDLPQLPELGGEVVVWDDAQVVGFAESWGKLRLIQMVAKQAEELRKMASEHMCKRMGPVKKVEVPGVGKFTHVVVKPGLVYDTRALDAHFSTLQDADLVEMGIKKFKEGYEYVLPTFDKDALERLRPEATNLLLNGVELASIRQLEEGDEE